MLKIFLIAILFITQAPLFAAQTARIEYIPQIDYSQINAEEMEKEAYGLYTIAMESTIAEERERNIIKALGLYRALLSKEPENVFYCLRLAELYDIYGKDRYAKEFYYRAITLRPDSYMPYEGFGNYYFARTEYRRALKQYNKAYIKDSGIYNVNNKLGTIYQKLGDTQSSLKYFKEANELRPSEELSAKIRLLEELNSSETVYYQNTRIHFVED